MAILFYSELDDPTDWKNAFNTIAESIPFYTWPNQPDNEEVEIAVVWKPTSGILKLFPNLKLIASLGAGVDHLFYGAEIPKGIPITRIVDETLTEQMVEYILMATLFCHRNMPIYISQQHKKQWQPVRQPLGRNRIIGIMGLGVLGSAVAKALRNLNFNIRGWSTSQKNLEGIQAYTGNDELKEFLTEIDILISLLPLTPKTENIINADLLSCLPHGSTFINGGRGAQVVESDLIRALDKGYISHAFLDVTREEPLPKKSELWLHPSVTLTPHVASITDAFSSSKQIINNYTRIKNGLDPINLVNSLAGY